MLYIIFGKHLFYLYLFNLVPFYVGLLCLVWGFYLRFSSKWVLLLLFPICIGNIYFQNFIQYHSFALPMLLFCGYSMLLFIVLIPLSPRFSRIALWSIGIVLFFALLWRHNAIFSVFPASFLLVYLYLRNRPLSTSQWYKYYISGMCIAACLSLAIAIIIPAWLKRDQAYPSNHIFIHQIAGACVPANDASCFPKEWYLPNKSFEDVKKLYALYPTIADVLAVPWYPDTRVFPTQYLPNLHKQWLHAITTYPLNFLRHELRFIKAMWLQEPGWLLSAQALQAKPTHPVHKNIVRSFPLNEQSITLSPLKERIYTALFTHKIVLNHIYGVLLSAIALILSAIGLYVYSRNNAHIAQIVKESSASSLESILASNADSSIHHHTHLEKSSTSINVSPNDSSKATCVNSCKKPSSIYGQRNEQIGLLVFSFSVGFAGFFSALCIALFSPATSSYESRYMSPILPLGILGVIGLIAWFLSYRESKRITQQGDKNKKH